MANFFFVIMILRDRHVLQNIIDAHKLHLCVLLKEAYTFASPSGCALFPSLGC